MSRLSDYRAGSASRYAAFQIAPDPEVASEDLQPKKRGILGRAWHDVTGAGGKALHGAMWALQRPQQVAYSAGRSLAESGLKGGDETTILQDPEGNQVGRTTKHKSFNPLTTAAAAAKGVYEGATGRSERIDPTTGKVERGDLSVWQATRGRDVVPTGVGKNPLLNIALSVGTDPLTFVKPGSSAGKLAKEAKVLEDAGLGARAAEFQRVGGKAVGGLAPAEKEAVRGAVKATAKNATEAKVAKIVEKKLARMGRTSPHAQLQVPGLKALSRGNIRGVSQGDTAETLARASGLSSGAQAAGKVPGISDALRLGGAAKSKIAPLFVTRHAARANLGEGIAGELGSSGRAGQSGRQSVINDAMTKSRVVMEGTTHEEQGVLGQALQASQGLPQPVALPPGYEHLANRLRIAHQQAEEAFASLAPEATAGAPEQGVLAAAGAPAGGGPAPTQGVFTRLTNQARLKAAGEATMRPSAVTDELAGVNAPDLTQTRSRLAQAAAEAAGSGAENPLHSPIPEAGTAPGSRRLGTGANIETSGRFANVKVGSRNVTISDTQLNEARQLALEAEGMSASDVKELLKGHPLGVNTKSELRDLVRRGERELSGVTAAQQEEARIAAYMREQQAVTSGAARAARAPEDIQRAFADASGLPAQEPVPNVLSEAAGAPPAPTTPGSGLPGSTPPPGLPGANVVPGAAAPKGRPYIIPTGALRRGCEANPEDCGRLLGLSPTDAVDAVRRRVVHLGSEHQLGDQAGDYEKALIESLGGPQHPKLSRMVGALRGQGDATYLEANPFRRQAAITESVENRNALKRVVEDFIGRSEGSVVKLEKGEKAPPGFETRSVPGVGNIAYHPSIKPEFERLAGHGGAFEDSSVRAFGSGRNALVRTYKSGALNYPGFTVKQTIGNVAATLAKGVRPQDWSRARDLQMAATKAETVMKDALRAGSDVDFATALKEAGTDPDIANEIMLARDNFGFSPGFFTEGVGVGGKTKFLRKAGARMEDQARLAAWLKEYGETGDPRQAGEFVADTLFDYSDLAPGMRAAKGAVNPFFTFTGKNLGYHARMLRENPAALAGQVHGMESLNQAAPTRLPGQEEQGKVYIPGLNRYASPNLPIQDTEKLAQIPANIAAATGGSPVAGQAAGQGAVSMLGGPLQGGIKYAYERATGKSSFTGSDFRGDKVQGIANVYPGISHAAQVVRILKGVAPGGDKDKAADQAIRFLAGMPNTKLDAKALKTERYNEADHNELNQLEGRAHDATRQIQKDKSNELLEKGGDTLPAAREEFYKNALAYQAAISKAIQQLPGYTQTKAGKAPTIRPYKASGSGNRGGGRLAAYRARSGR